jgi:hypothetical protein
VSYLSVPFNNLIKNVSRFSRKTSVYSPSYSSGVFSFCVSNLTHELRCAGSMLIFYYDTEQYERYNTDSLIISAMTPGRVEPNAEHLQNCLKVIVDDLLML